MSKFPNNEITHKYFVLLFFFLGQLYLSQTCLIYLNKGTNRRNKKYKYFEQTQISKYYNRKLLWLGFGNKSPSLTLSNSLKLKTDMWSIYKYLYPTDA